MENYAFKIFIFVTGTVLLITKFLILILVVTAVYMYRSNNSMINERALKIIFYEL